MALEVVGGAFLSASLQVLFADIHSIVDFVRRNKVDEELLRQLRNKLLLANGVLDDAERQQITKPDVREWLEQLKHAIQNTEDSVDDVKTEALRCQLAAHRNMGIRARNFFSSRFAVKDVERRIQNIIKSVDDIVEDMNRLGLREGVQTSIPFPIQRSSLNILAKESDVYGRDAEKEVIIKFLLSDGGHKISVMPIVGMGGLGKTTLAQLVYNMIDGKAEVMEKPFVIKAWITVSDESKSDVFTLTKAICEKVPELQLDNTIKETFQLQLKLKEALQGKKFLFVLDDVWNVDFQTWKDLQIPFESAANGSKIIVTTRLSKIAKDLGTAGSEALDLALLSEDDGWKLFSKHAFDFENVKPSSFPHLEKIGRKIVGKCKGNPLAVKSLGCLLHSQLNPKEWENVLVNDIWELEQGEGGILPALWLSYYYLPPHLKGCFAYCSIFPKDFKFSKEKLIWLWMAENLLQPQNNMMSEEVGEKYFEDLTSRSFFIVGKYGNFTMHDLVNDLAKFVSGESCLRLDGNCSGNLTNKTRRISCMADETSDISKKMEDLSKNKVLRTLLVLGNSSGGKKQYNINPKELRSMQYLRVLSASPIFFTFEGRTKLFKSIGSLKLLRYLDLSHNEGVEEIPDTICKLYNLQTLLLQGCENLAKLPDSIGNLKHLRHLDLSGTPIEKIPDTICNLHELRTFSLADCWKLTQSPYEIKLKLTNLCKLDTGATNLAEFAVGKSSGIEELGNLTNLRGDLRIRSLENVEEVEDVSKANLKNKKYITKLTLEWNHDRSDVSHNKAREVLDRLQPHTNLAELSVINYEGRSFPDWMGHHSFCCMTFLRLEGCKNCDRLPPLGELPSLETLEIQGLDMVERIGDEFYLNDSSSTSPPFKSLRILTFKNMGEWKEWSSVGGAFPNLKELQLIGCPKLKGDRLPPLGELPSLETLEIQGFDMVERIGDEFYLNDSSSSSSPPFKSLRSLRFQNMGEWKEWSLVGGAFPNLKELQLIGCPKLKGDRLPPLGELPSLETLEIQGFDMVERIGDEFYLNDSSSSSSPPFKSLRSLRFQNMGEWKEWSLVGGAFPNLKELQLIGCPKLKGDRLPPLGELPSLETLEIQGFDMVERIGDEFYLNDSSSSSSPPFKSLRSLRFQNMGEWKEWSLVGGAFPNLKELQLIGCPKLKGDRLPPLGELPSLEWLEIEGLDKVERIGDEFYLNDSSSSSPPFKSLRSLIFKNMGEWKEWSSVGGAFPNLKYLTLWDCPKLKRACLPDIYLPSLEHLEIRDNHHVVASLAGCQLSISDWGGMKSFPQGRLPSTIQSIEIWNCYDLESLSEEGWPCSNLKSLDISICNKKLFAHGNKWNLGMLTSLTSLVIYDVDMEGVDSFPEEEGQLPTTLTSLGLWDIRNLKSLNGRALRHLTSLQSLQIGDCQQLQCLAEERLPASLSELSISGCPLLKPRCQRGIGQDWDTIHHIPNIMIDEERI